MGRKPETPERKLGTYRKKRDFDVTREPRGQSKKGEGRMFVIQKHHARRLHWDLRLEVGGVLASWAVPKEPPHHTGVKRLAVHVEDHPIEYATFEGEIPKGEYGAGKVEIWDKGTYESDDDVEKQIEEGKLVFTLHGERLDGTYGLVRMKPREDSDDKDSWLLFMEGRQDKLREPSHVKKGHAPARLEPMLCTRKTEPPKGETWVHEIKWDGYRVLAFVKGGKATLKSRNDNILKLPELEKVLTEADEIEEGVIDGELVSVDERGVSNFKLAHAQIASKDTKDLVLYAFDLPFFAGMDLRESPLEERKAVLERLIEQIGSERLRFSSHVEGNASQLLVQACEAGLEGLISKKKGSSYSSGRSSDWVKVRCERKLQGWIGGFTRLSSGEDMVGALLIGIRDDEGRLVYVGKAGTGLSDAMRSNLWKELTATKAEVCPFEKSADLPRKGAFWTRPEQMAEVQYLEWSEGGVMRQPKLLKILKEKEAQKTRISSEPVELEAVESEKKVADKTKTKAKAGEMPVKITHPERLIDPQAGLTKGDVAAFYHEVAEFILPYLENRPLPVLRCPDGITGSCFFHKHWIRGLTESVLKVDIEEESGDDEPYMAVTDEKGLLGLAQFGVIEFHPWGSLIETLEQPDILIFDLDPGEDMKWGKVVEAAHQVRQQLESIGLNTFAKLSGGKGVHVVVPIEPELEWDEAKAFCENFARIMAKEFPKTYTAELPKVKRKGKIFLDYLRNGRGATAVTAYSVRARANLPVAMPVEWDEVNAKLAPNAFDLRKALKHIEKRRADPWKDFYASRRSLRSVLSP